MRLVRRLDHVVAVFDGAQTAFEHLTEELGLPVAWPLQDYPGVVSGGVGFGNLNVEFVPSRSDNSAHAPVSFSGLAFEPETDVNDAYVARLTASEVRHEEPVTTPGWTIVKLLGLLDGADTFICDYHIPGAKDASIRRDALLAAQGGVLRVQGVVRVVLGVHDMDHALREWSKILGPTTHVDENLWECDDGAAVQLVLSDHDGVVDIVIEARGHEVARHDPSDRDLRDILSGLPLTFARTGVVHVAPSRRREVGR